MKCENINCQLKHDGAYGSGRFCSKKCASSFSTQNKREEINKKVSIALKGQKGNGKSFKKGFDERRKIFTKEDRIIAIEKWKEKSELLYNSKDFDKLSLNQKKRRVKEEQNNKCFNCDLQEWLGEKISLEVHHINDELGDIRENLIALCPNCHSLTPTWRKSWRKLKQY